ncbi:retrovirus-related Pol polyprotein from transposon 297 [Trichonephila clavipes]|nr:retrovirus-related Pol polyprotein from transposon 297 [Trichonephila clavipes]
MRWGGVRTWLPPVVPRSLDSQGLGSAQSVSVSKSEADLEYPCILGIDFISESNIILEFFRKSLAIPDSQIDKVVETIEEERIERDKPGLAHALYHMIGTGDNLPVVSRPYRSDRVKQEILDYHVDKMLKEGIIIPIQSAYESPVVLCRKNNGLPSDNLEAYRFAVDYRKLNAITNYPRYPLRHPTRFEDQFFQN